MLRHAPKALRDKRFKKMVIFYVLLLLRIGNIMHRGAVRGLIYLMTRYFLKGGIL